MNRESDESDESDDLRPPACRVRDIPEAVSLSLPDRVHSLSQRLFTFARALKAFESTSGSKLPDDELKNAFAQWFQRAKPQLGEGAVFDEYLFEFMEAYRKAIHPLGANIIEAAWKAAQAHPDPAEAKRYSTSPKIKLLVSLCRQLQLLSGDSPFFLSTTTVWKLFGLKSRSIAFAWLSGLCADGVMELTAHGEANTNPKLRRANRYRFNFATQAPPLPPRTLS